MDTDKALQAAFGHFQAGDYHRAEQTCRAIIDNEPDNAHVLHLLGIIQYQQGNLDSAIVLINQSLQIDPDRAHAYFDLGTILREQGHREKAVANFRKAIEIDPRFDAAYYNLGIVLKESGRLDDAITSYRKAIEMNPNHADTHNNLGLAFQEKGLFDEAEKAFRKSLQINPYYAHAEYNLGNLFLERKQPDAAIAHYTKALELDPTIIDARTNLGNAFKEKGLLAEAIAVYQETLAMHPHRSDIYYNLGIILKDSGRLDEAITSYQKALLLEPDYADAHNNLGLALQDKGRYEEAIRSFRKAIELEPDNPVFHWNLSVTLLLTGNFEEGWQEYEWRLKVREFPNRTTSQPRWDGSDIAGKTILLHAEQGYGDTIQFIRYAPLVAQRGATVIVECMRDVASLLKGVEGINHVIMRGDTPPGFDIHCPLLSLPFIFHTGLESIPARTPYIRVDYSLVEKWGTKLKKRNSHLKIGLVWAGREQRTLSLNMFAPLAEVEGITLYSLQKGEAAEQAKRPPAGMKLLDYTADIHDFSDTAAFIENLDLVISVDTAVAHLAGAVGKPVWTLLPFVPDWRWMLNRDDSPWYPTMRLFRQPEIGDWNSVIERVTAELRKFIETRN